MTNRTALNYDVVIVGAGPAGLCAALYAGRGLLKAVTIEAHDTLQTLATKIQRATGFSVATSIVTVLPNIYDAAQLDEFVAATERPPLTEDDLSRIAELYDNGFFLEPAPAGA